MDAGSSKKVLFTDFSKSYLYWITSAEKSYGRFSLESKCTFIKKRQEKETFWLASAVMAGNVYEDDNLAKEPPYHFQLAASENEYLIFRDYLMWEQGCDSGGFCPKIFHKLEIHSEELSASKVADMVEIAKLARLGNSFNSIVCFQVNDNKFILEFPVKHINIRADNGQFQVETGPILVPNMTSACGQMNKLGNKNQFQTAFIFFNCLDRAELLLKESPQVGSPQPRSYSGVQKIQAEICLITPEND